MNIRGIEDFRHWAKEEHSKNMTKRIIVRCDLNLPSDVKDLTRVQSIRKTVHEILHLGFNVVLISHYKRPEPADIGNQKYSLANVVDDVSEVLGVDVQFVKQSVFDITPNILTSPVTLLENLRFYEGEKKNDDSLAKELSKLGDAFVNDAFSVSHRAHASVAAITKFLPSFAGFSLQNEVLWLSKIVSDVRSPFTAIIGGSKISTKIDVLRKMAEISDYLVIAGAMANVFLSAKGTRSAAEIDDDQMALAADIMQNSKAEIVLPVDFCASTDINTDGQNYELGSVPGGFECFDIGERSIQKVIEIVSKSSSVLWNGPTGAFEFANFGASSAAIARALAEKTKHCGLISIAGGGETIAALGTHKDDLTFVSTGGGAFLEFIAGDVLPGIAALIKT